MDAIMSYWVPGKIIICGEHAVVYGVPALAMPIAKGMRLELIEGEIDEFVLSFDGGGTTFRAREDGAPLEKMLYALQSEFQSAFTRKQVRVFSELPTSSGLGSSAALGVGLLNIACHQCGVTANEQELFEQAMKLERFFHGNPSGVDHASIIAGELIRYEKGRTSLPWMPCTPEAMPGLVVAHGGPHQGTEKAVSALRRRADSNPKWFQSCLETIQNIVNQTERALLNGDWVKAGQLLSENHVVLSDFGVSTPNLDALCDKAIQAGALGAKLTGAGCGGAMIALCQPEDRQKVVRALEESATVL